LKDDSQHGWLSIKNTEIAAARWRVIRGTSIASSANADAAHHGPRDESTAQ
jgi:hypothetical protein